MVFEGSPYLDLRGSAGPLSDSCREHIEVQIQKALSVARTDEIHCLTRWTRFSKNFEMFKLDMLKRTL